MSKKYYIISGEASGDLHGSNLMKVILKKEPDAEFRFWGGDLMKEVGGTLVKSLMFGEACSSVPIYKK